MALLMLTETCALLNARFKPIYNLKEAIKGLTSPKSKGEKGVVEEDHGDRVRQTKIGGLLKVYKVKVTS